jgi:hypothetical protein
MLEERGAYVALDASEGIALLEGREIPTGFPSSSPTPVPTKPDAT